jgi:histone-lysine N-methyltransferase SETMAR
MKGPGQLTTGMRLLHDGAKPHTSFQTAARFQNWKLKVLQHLPHSPDIAPSDFYLLGPFKNFLSGKRFEDQNALQKTIVQYLTFHGKEHYHEGMFKLVK